MINNINLDQEKNVRITINPSPKLYWQVPDGIRGKKYEILVEIAEDPDFTKNIRIYCSKEDKEPFSFASPREANSLEQVYIQLPYPLI